MEYLEGETLAACLERTVTLSWQTACAIAQRIASAVGAAHAHGIVHRDLKPGNVFVSRVAASSNVTERRIKVLDFGLAKLLSDDRGQRADHPRRHAPGHADVHLARAVQRRGAGRRPAPTSTRSAASSSR